MQKRYIRLRKSLVKAVLLSTVVMIAIGVVSSIVLQHLPGSAFAQIQAFKTMNNDSPAVYSTQLFNRLSQVSNQIDLIVTTVSMLVAGAVFGWILAPHAARRKISLEGAVYAFIMSAVIIGASWWALWFIQETNLEASGYTVQMAFSDSLFWTRAILQTAVWTAVFTGMASLSAFVRQSPKAKTTGQVLPAKSK